jgi:hypothetical protein
MQCDNFNSEQFPEDGRVRLKHVTQFNFMFNATLSKEVIVNKFAFKTEISV